MELLFIIAIGIGIWLLIRSQQTRARSDVSARQQHAIDQDRRWQAVRRVAEEDVTQLGQQIADTPVATDLSEEGRQDFDDALAAYERGKNALEAAQQPDDLQWVTRSVDDGRFSLARVTARLKGQDVPSRTPPCFFDQRHGLSIGDRLWAPPEGAERDVPVCAACAARIDDGQDPQVRLVETPQGQRPYYEGGPEYGPWARGWYAGSGLHVMNSAMLGMLLLHSMYLPIGYSSFDGADAAGADGAGGDYGDGDYGGESGGDYSGGDYGGGDYGGGGFDSGGFDFGGF